MSTILRLIDQFLKNQRAAVARVDFVVGVSRGGLIPAALIATTLDKPLVAAYIDRRDRVYLDRGAWIRGKRLLLVDDIVRTGKTFGKITRLLERHRPAKIQSFTLYCLNRAAARPTWTKLISADRKMPWDR